MCQLLGMNCAAPTDFSFSFRGFRVRGGGSDIHSHGFGVSIYEGRGLRTFLDTLPAATSPVAELVQRYPVRTYVSFRDATRHVMIHRLMLGIFISNVIIISLEYDGAHSICHNWERQLGECSPFFSGAVGNSMVLLP